MLTAILMHPDLFIVAGSYAGFKAASYFHGGIITGTPVWHKVFISWLWLTVVYEFIPDQAKLFSVKINFALD